MSKVFDIADLKAEGLHVVIKTTQLLSDLREVMAWSIDEPCNLQDMLYREHGWYKPQSGMNHLLP
jgi:hypothetical protein